MADGQSPDSVLVKCLVVAVMVRLLLPVSFDSAISVFSFLPKPAAAVVEHATPNRVITRPEAVNPGVDGVIYPWGK